MCIVLGFWRNFADLFDLTEKKVYVTGVSYAGQYVPYIVSAMLDSDDINLQGSMVYDPAISDDVPLVEGMMKLTVPEKEIVVAKQIALKRLTM